MKTVIFDANNNGILVNIDGEDVGLALQNYELVDLLIDGGVKKGDKFYNSSSMDFATEHGFAGDNYAHEMVEYALQVLFNVIGS